MRALVIVMLLVTTAFAEPPTSREPTYENYGHQVVIVDAIGVAMFTGGTLYLVKSESDERAWALVPMLLGGIIYTGGSAAFHDAHGNKSAAYGAPWLKAIVPTAGLFCGAMFTRRLGGNEVAGAIAGASIGVVTATTLDAVWIARAPVPVIAPVEGGATVGLVATF